MKKAILTIGLFSLVMVLTSFTSSEEIISTTKNNNKVEVFTVENVQLNLVGNGSTTAGNKKVD